MPKDIDVYKQLVHDYGMVMTVDELARVLKYPSSNAVRQAHAAGRLPVPLQRFPGRRALFAPTHKVADAIVGLDISPSQAVHKEPEMVK